jgi:hypothetical protein
MTDSGHLWAIGFDEMERATRLQREAIELAERHCLVLVDSAVAVRYPDGSFTLNGQPFMVFPIPLHEHSWASSFARLALGAPALTAAAAGSARDNRRSPQPTLLGSMTSLSATCSV